MCGHRFPFESTPATGGSAQSGYEVFEHGADIGVRGWGPSLEQAFEQAAKAMFSLMVDDLQSVQESVVLPVKTSGYDQVSLFVAWLNALLTESDLQQMLFTSFQVTLEDGFTLHGWAAGEPFAAHKSEQGVEVKGATFCQAEVFKQDHMWVAQCVVDV